jgi:hypothetical protein
MAVPRDLAGSAFRVKNRLIASRSQHSTMRAINHRIARWLSVLALISSATYLIGAASVSMRRPCAAREAHSKPASRFRSSTRPVRALRCTSIVESAVLLLPRLAASSMAASPPRIVAWYGRPLTIYRPGKPPFRMLPMATRAAPLRCLLLLARPAKAKCRQA